MNSFTIDIIINFTYHYYLNSTSNANDVVIVLKVCKTFKSTNATNNINQKPQMSVERSKLLTFYGIL